MTNWTEDKKATLAQLYPEHTNAEIASILGVTKSAVMAQAFKQKLFKTPEFHKRTSSKGYFPKGHRSFNKGKKWDEFMSKEAQESSRKTTFKKGHTPKNHKPIGTEVIEPKNGYIKVKISEPNGWVLKHRHIWQQHNGIIPKGYNIQFKDKDKRDFNIENLYMINRNEQMAENSIIRYPANLRTAIKRIGKIKKLIKEHESNKY